MSYSFHFRAADKAEARSAAAAEFDKVVEAQPNHAHDRQQAEAAFNAFLDLVEEPAATDDLAVTVSGWVQWRFGEESTTYVGANVSVGISHAAKPTVG